jgi:ribosomal protein S17
MAEENKTAESKPRRHHQEKIGVVTSAKMQKTIVVEVRRRVPHPVYKRILTKRSKFMAHDEHAHEGDMAHRGEPAGANKVELERSYSTATTGV